MSENPGLPSYAKDCNNRDSLSSRENNCKSTSIVYGYLHVSFCKYIYNKVNTAS